jgi:hypothetical protein
MGWRSYYLLCPDYRTSHEEIFSAGDRIAAIGAAGSTIAAVGGLAHEHKWRIPAAWLAGVEKGLVREWLSYAAKPAHEHCCKLKTDE